MSGETMRVVFIEMSENAIRICTTYLSCVAQIMIMLFKATEVGAGSGNRSNIIVSFRST